MKKKIEKCIEGIIKILINEKIDENKFFDCIHTLENICCEKSENSEIKALCINGIVEISKNKDIDQFILFECIDVLQEIYKKYENSENSKILEQCINGIIEISKNKKINQNNLCNCIYSLKNICEKSTDSEIKGKCINGIIEISKNENINQSNLSTCIHCLKEIYEKYENSKIKEKCINGIIKILENKIYIDIDNLGYISANFENSDIKNKCIDKIIKILNNQDNESYISDKCIDTLKNICIKSKNSEIKGKCINKIKEILKKYIEKLNNETSNNENNNSGILSKCKYCINALKYIAVNPKIKDRQECIKAIIEILNSEDSKSQEIKKQCIQAIIEISKNNNIDQYIFSYSIGILKNICKEPEKSEIKGKCINGIKEIFEKHIKNLKNENDNSDILSKCKNCINALGDIAADSKIEDGQKCIEVIKEMSNNKILFYCIDALGSIGAKSTIQETQEQCITKIEEIFKNEIEKSSNDKKFMLDILSHYIDALGSIGAKSTIQDTQKQCINTLKSIFTNFQIQETQKRCIEKIKEILENNIKILGNKCIMDILVKCTEYMDDLKYFAANSENEKTQEPFIKKIIEISKESDDQYKLLCCIYSLKDIYEKSEISYIQGKCIEGIQEILKHKNHNLVLLKPDFTLKKYCEKVLKELDDEAFIKKQQNKTQEQNYTEIYKPKPFKSSSVLNGATNVLNGNNQSNNKEEGALIQCDNEEDSLIRYDNDELLKRKQDNTKYNNKKKSNDKSHNLFKILTNIFKSKKEQGNTKNGGYEILK